MKLRILPFVALALAISSCDSFQDVDVVAARMANATATEIVKQEGTRFARTATALVRTTQGTPEPTATSEVQWLEDCLKEHSALDCSATAIARAANPEDIPPPEREAIGTVELEGGCAPYFEEAGEALQSLTRDMTRLGVLCSGTPTLEVLSQAHAGAAVEVRLRGPVELHEIGLQYQDVKQLLESGRSLVGRRGQLIGCEPHGTEHVGEKEDTHCHFLINGKQVAQLPSEWPYEIVSDVLGPDFTLEIRLLIPFWVRGINLKPIQFTSQ